MKKTVCLCAVLALASAACGEGMWTGLTDDAHVMGPKLTEADLVGKVVLVDSTFEPRIEQIWTSFKTKRFMTVGSVRASGKIPGGLTYPVYKKFGLAEGNPNGRLFVVNHRGRVVYSGQSDRDATEAVVNALGQVGAPLSLTGAVTPSLFKAMGKKLVLGKNIKSDVKTLEGAVEKAKKKTATKVDREKGAEAAELLKAIAEGKADAMREIAVVKRTNPSEALKLIKDFTVTFPEEGKAYQELVTELNGKLKTAKGKK